MPRLLLGAVIAALVMFVVGFAFYATPLSTAAVSKVDDAAGTQIQSALRQLPADGFYVIPNPQTEAGQAGFAQGPTAFVHLHKAGRPVFEPATLIKGLVHYLIVALLLGFGLRAVEPGSRSIIAVLIAAVAVTFIHFGGPIWWSYNWRTAAFFAVADFCSLAAGGLVMARFLRSQQRQ